MIFQLRCTISFGFFVYLYYLLSCMSAVSSLFKMVLTARQCILLFMHKKVKESYKKKLHNDIKVAGENVLISVSSSRIIG